VVASTDFFSSPKQHVRLLWILPFYWLAKGSSCNRRVQYCRKRRRPHVLSPTHHVITLHRSPPQKNTFQPHSDLCKTISSINQKSVVVVFTYIIIYVSAILIGPGVVGAINYLPILRILGDEDVLSVIFGTISCTG